MAAVHDADPSRNRVPLHEKAAGSSSPIFHQLQRRVETHIFLCVLAYHLLVAIEKTLLNKEVHTSWATLRETLETHQVATIVLPTDGDIVDAASCRVLERLEAASTS